MNKMDKNWNVEFSSSPLESIPTIECHNNEAFVRNDETDETVHRSDVSNNSDDSKHSGERYGRSTLAYDDILDGNEIYNTIKIQHQDNQMEYEGEDFIVQRKRPFRIKYETLVWIVITIATVCTCVDRFVGSGDFILRRSGKRVSKLRGEHFGQTLAAILWAFSGRLIIVSQNVMFFTALWYIPNTMAEHLPGWVDLNGVLDVHRKIHKITGIALIGIPTVMHVLLVFVPPVVDKTKLFYHPPTHFNYSKQYMNLNWTKWWDPAAVSNFNFNAADGVHMTSDELFRLVSMLLLFCVLFPLSRSTLLNKRSFSWAMIIHAVAAVWYAVDNIRKISHGLAHVFNLPMLIVWLLDVTFATLFYRRREATTERVAVYGKNQYVDIKVKIKGKESSEHRVGDIYYMIENPPKNGRLERAHPFTSYSNHTMDESWDIGFIVSVMEGDRQWTPAYSRRLCKLALQKEQFSLKCWGPYRSAVSDIYRHLQDNQCRPLVLIATGSGFGYILDVLNILVYKMPNAMNKIEIHYSVSCTQLREVYMEEIEHHLSIIRERGQNVDICWYNSSNQQQISLVKHFEGRMDMELIVSKASKNTLVYFVGRPTLADRLATICRHRDVSFVREHVNSQRGKSDARVFATYAKWGVIGCVVALLGCMALAVYIRS